MTQYHLILEILYHKIDEANAFQTSKVLKTLEVFEAGFASGGSFKFIALCCNEPWY